MDKKQKDGGNPFAAIDASKFPSKKPGVPAARHRPADVLADVPQDPEDALFARAMSQVKPVAKDKAARTTEPDEPDAVFARMFADAKAKSGKEKHGKGKYSQDASNKEASRPDAASALAPLVNKAGVSPLSEVLGVTDENAEARSFFAATQDVAPLNGKGREVPPEPTPAPTPLVRESNPLQDIVDGKVEFALSASDEFVEAHVVGLDLLTVGKLQARQYSPEAHIDLHGLNSEQAFHALVDFTRLAYMKGQRILLVVTGRGLNSPDGMPVLRLKLQEWLTQDPFRRVVLAFCTAKREDGGPGALYVLLRKHRKDSGKVRWDAFPADPDLFL